MRAAGSCTRRGFENFETLFHQGPWHFSYNHYFSTTSHTHYTVFPVNYKIFLLPLPMKNGDSPWPLKVNAKVSLKYPDIHLSE